MSKKTRRVEAVQPSYPTADAFDAGRRGLRRLLYAALVGGTAVAASGCWSIAGNARQPDAGPDGQADEMRTDGKTDLVQLPPDSDVALEGGSETIPDRGHASDAQPE